MNAYELADKTEELGDEVYDNPLLIKAGHMLRQQADQIAHLEMMLANRNEIIDKLDLNPQTNAEPVAWRYENEYEDNFCYTEDECLVKSLNYKNIIPLYTTPQTKPKCHKCWDSGLVGGYSNESMPTECSCKAPQTKPLSDEEIWKELTKVKHTWIATTSVWFEFERDELTKAIRAIEERILKK